MKAVLDALSITTLLTVYNPLHPATCHPKASQANYSRIFHTVFLRGRGICTRCTIALFKTAAMIGDPKEQRSRSLPIAQTETAHDVILRAPGRDSVSGRVTDRCSQPRSKGNSATQDSPSARAPSSLNQYRFGLVFLPPKR